MAKAGNPMPFGPKTLCRREGVRSREREKGKGEEYEEKEEEE